MDAPRIRELNDALRRTLMGGQIVFTSGFTALPMVTKAKALIAMRRYDGFTPDNDPFGEHDFGAFEVDEVKFFFKFTYFDLTMEYGSDDPANPEVTKRVLTLMLVDEY